MGREAQRLHLPVKTQCFVHLGISCELGNRKKWDGRQTGGIYLWKANVLRSLEEDQQHAHWCFHNRVWRPKDVKTSENETVDGQNIQTLQHALCWTPAPPNLNVSARVLPKVMLGVWFLSSIGANALQVTLTLNFGELYRIEGVKYFIHLRYVTKCYQVASWQDAHRCARLSSVLHLVRRLDLGCRDWNHQRNTWKHIFEGTVPSHCQFALL